MQTDSSPISSTSHPTFKAAAGRNVGLRTLLGEMYLDIRGLVGLRGSSASSTDENSYRFDLFGIRAAFRNLHHLT